MQHSRWSKVWFCALVGATSAWAANQAGGAARPVLSYPAYRIGPGDVLQIDVWKEPEASMASITVRPDGMISLAMIGEMPAADRTPAELEALLAEKYGQLIRDARVTVTVREVTSQRVYLIGELRREGPVRMVGRLTVLQALAEAGGITDYAKRNRIYILRTTNGRQVKLPF